MMQMLLRRASKVIPAALVIRKVIPTIFGGPVVMPGFTHAATGVTVRGVSGVTVRTVRSFSGGGGAAKGGGAASGGGAAAAGGGAAAGTNRIDYVRSFFRMVDNSIQGERMIKRYGFVVGTFTVVAYIVAMYLVDEKKDTFADENNSAAQTVKFEAGSVILFAAAAIEAATNSKAAADAAIAASADPFKVKAEVKAATERAVAAVRIAEIAATYAIQSANSALETLESMESAAKNIQLQIALARDVIVSSRLSVEVALAASNSAEGAASSGGVRGVVPGSAAAVNN